MVELVEKTGLIFALTHNYTGYTMIKQASEYAEFLTVYDGVRGMAFIENVVASAKSQQKWYKFQL